MKMSIGLALNRRRANTGNGFDLTLTVDAEIEIDGATGEITVTVTSPAAYANYNAGNGAGIFIFNGDDLATGPVNLVPPVVVDDGSPASGETLTLTPGLWVYRPSNGGLGSPTYQWQADTAGNASFANIGGATSNSYTLTASESGDGVRVQESLADNGGSRTATSAAVSVAAAASHPTFTQIASGQNNTNVNNGPGPLFSGIDISAIPEGDEVMFVIAWTDLTTTGSLTAPTVSGWTLNAITGASNNGSATGGVPHAYLYRATKPAAANTIDLQMGTVTDSARGWTYFIYHVQNRTTDVATSVRENADGVTSVTTVNGGSVFSMSIATDTDDNCDPHAWTEGATKDGADVRSPTRCLTACAKAENVTAGTRTVTAPRPANASANTVITLSVS